MPTDSDAKSGDAQPSLLAEPRPEQLARLLPLFSFVGALGLGTFLVFNDILQPWSPAVLVVAYALFLFANIKRVPLTGEIKDSAYYLGFSLNLVFLLVAFRNYGPQASGTGAVEYLIRSLGSAITATIAGLIARYALYVVDDEELVQKQVFSELQDEIKKSVAGFRQSQRSLIQGITTFIQSRQRLAEQEQAASREYLDNIEGLLKTLQTLQTSHVSALTHSVRSLEPAAELSLRQVRHINDELVQLRQSLTAAELGRTLDGVKRALGAVDASAQGVHGRFSNLSQGIDEARKRLSEMAQVAPAIGADLAAVDAILVDFIEVLRHRVAALK